MNKSTRTGKGAKVTARPPAATPAHAAPLVALAAHLSAILKNPHTPVGLYNAIGEELCNMSSDIDYHTPEMIARTIAAYTAREEKRQKGGAR